MGMDDYIQRMHPEDDMTIMGDYLMYKCYPDYTALRLGMNLDRDTDPELTTNKHKGKAITVGLWMFTTDSREPMKDVMMRLDLFEMRGFYLILEASYRLRDYIQRGERYPERFRYRPDHPPPSNALLKVSNDSSPEQTPEGDRHSSQVFPIVSHYPVVTKAKISITHSSNQDNRHQPTSATTSMSEIDKLFSKIAPGQPQSQSPSPVPVKRGKQGISLDGILAAAMSGQNSSTNPPASANSLQTQPVPSTNTNRSLALLDSIFASATPHPPNGHNGTGPLQSSASTLQIVSPQPTSPVVPQVLNQNVISTLLGLSPSPGGSASSSSTSITAYRYEGDNESNSEGGSEEIEYPASNVNSILDEATRDAITSSSKGKQSSVPSFSFPASLDDLQATPRIQGDVTPRPTLKGMPASPLQQPKEKDPKVGTTRKPQNGHTPADVPQVPSTKTDKTKPASGAPRKLVPFEPDSELWPYPRRPLDDRASDDDDEVVELDFTETSALSDLNTFLPKSKANANATGGAGALGKKKKKEKNKEERDQIEKSWDDPVKMGYAIGPNIPNESPAKPVQLQPTAVPSVNGKTKPVQANGQANGQPTASASQDKEKNEGGLDRDAVTESLASTVAKSSLSKHKDLKQMDRNTFVREVLTLFYVSSIAPAIHIG